MECNVSDKLYIDRTAAIMTAMNYDGNGNAQDASQDIASALSALPAADVRPVVRCKDCKYGIPDKSGSGLDMINCQNKETPSGFFPWLCQPDWFCADGEPRETEPQKCDTCPQGAHWDGVVVCGKDAQRHERTDGCKEV